MQKHGIYSLCNDNVICPLQINTDTTQTHTLSHTHACLATLPEA